MILLKNNGRIIYLREYEKQGTEVLSFLPFIKEKIDIEETELIPLKNLKIELEKTQDNE